jgi:ABC-type nitrate/sulfonate/bicarbonate transport system permease component
MDPKKLLLLRFAPAVILVAVWEFAVRGNDRLAFFFGTPSKIIDYLVSRIGDGSLVADFTVTKLV